MSCLLRAIFPFLIPGLVTLSGCQSERQVDPAEVAQHRSKLVLADEPDGAQTVLDVRAAMYGVDPADMHTHEHEEGEHAHEHDDDAGESGDHAHSDATHEEHAHDEDGEESGKEHAHDEEHAHEHEDAEHRHDDHDHAVAKKAPPEPKVTEMDVVLVGMVGGVPNPSKEANPEFPFAKNQAVFFLADPEAVGELEEHGHQHAPGEECSFCAAHAADSAALIAAVQFKDERNNILPIDARQLFELNENDLVVVKGKARLSPSGMMTVDATGLYVRQ